MNENKTSRYLKYAVGEIILVVIGILLALQINTWNENRKIRAFQSEIITLIDENLKQDSISLAREIQQSKKALASTDYLFQQLSEGHYPDTLNFIMGDIINFQRFRSQSSAFEVLKAKGIDKLKNNSLRLALISYYDEMVPITYVTMLDIEKSFNTDWLPILKEDFSDFKWMKYAVPKDAEAFFTKPSSIIMFKLFKDNRTGQVNRMESAMEQIIHIRALIDNIQDD